MPRTAGNHLKLGERSGEFPAEPSEGAWPCRHFDFGILASRTVREKISVVEFVVL